MFLLWLVFSGKSEPLLLGFGVVASLIVSGFSHRFLFPEPDFKFYFRTACKFSCYIPWLLAQIFLANIHLLRLVFHPRIREKIDPHLVDFPTRLRSDIAIATLANSITLTPGTITVTADQHGEFRVHAIDRQSSQALPGEMERKVARVFGER
jgi:multicomponent Na+:H+ antiporter subunit E